ncbi:hypothetical protein CHARACLAT_025753 [Characodon lateralis]|uniref:Interleukin-4 n=1 Tax=Characodon lateralis TaxID=208331 RepID=A0ABU7ECU0_9TELE|nr:hypothetical protein [Characodon lateralis]
MAGLFVSTWTLSLLLLSFFMSFKQTSANPICTTNCSIYEFQKNVNALGDLAEKCPRIFSLVTNSTCDFPGRIADVVKTLLNEQCLKESKIPNIRSHIKYLIRRLDENNLCPGMVEMYCSNEENSGPIVSLKDLHTKLYTLLMKFKMQFSCL